MDRSSGTIRANQPVPLILQPQDSVGNFKNTGLLEAVNGGTLTFRISDFENFSGDAIGQIQADQATLRVIDSVTIFGGKVDLIGTSMLDLSNGSLIGTTTTNDATGVIKTTFGRNNRLSGVVQNPSGGRIVLGDATSLAFDQAGTYQNAGTIELAGEGEFTSFSGTALLIDGRVELQGGGDVLLSNTLDNVIQTAASASEQDNVLVNQDHRIHGGGQLGRNVMGFINRGTIDADQPFIEGQSQSGSIWIDPGGAFRKFVNEGLVQASNRGTLRLLNGEYENVAGHIRAMDGSRVELEQAVTIRGGLLETRGSGEIHVNRDVVFDGVDMQLNGNIKVNETGALRLTGDIVNRQQIAVERGRILAEGEVVLTGGGEINLSNSNLNRITPFGTNENNRLTNMDNLIQGSGFINLAFANRGVIDANQPALADDGMSGILIIDAAGPDAMVTRA